MKELRQQTPKLILPCNYINSYEDLSYKNSVFKYCFFVEFIGNPTRAVHTKEFYSSLIGKTLDYQIFSNFQNYNAFLLSSSQLVIFISTYSPLTPEKPLSFLISCTNFDRKRLRIHFKTWKTLFFFLEKLEKSSHFFDFLSVLPSLPKKTISHLTLHF